MDNDSRVMTASEVAEIFRVLPKTVSAWAREGRLVGFRTLGGHHRFHEKEVMKLWRESQARE